MFRKVRYLLIVVVVRSNDLVKFRTQTQRANRTAILIFSTVRKNKNNDKNRLVGYYRSAFARTSSGGIEPLPIVISFFDLRFELAVVISRYEPERTVHYI